MKFGGDHVHGEVADPALRRSSGVAAGVPVNKSMTTAVCSAGPAACGEAGASRLLARVGRTVAISCDLALFAFHRASKFAAGEDPSFCTCSI